MKKKYEVLFYIDKLSTKKDQNDPSNVKPQTLPI